MKSVCEILEGYIGKRFWCPLVGDEVILLKADPRPDANKKYNAIRIKTVHDGREIGLLSDGSYFWGGECMIYPSKDSSDWGKWEEEQKPKAPKTWSEFKKISEYQHNIGANITYNYYSVLNEGTCDASTVSHTPIERSSLAFLKIHQLIKVGYGGNVTKEDLNKWTAYIFYDTLNKIYNISTVMYSMICPIMFHTREQADDFLSYQENLELLNDYFMI